MNIQQLRYMVEVEKAGSITKAASRLFMGQPNLSKAIKDAENEIGITVFRRTAKGVCPTEKGAEFLLYAKEIISKMEKLEALYRPDGESPLRLSLSLPRAGYITEALAELINSLGKGRKAEAEIYDLAPKDAIDSLLSGETDLAVIRCGKEEKEHIIRIITEKGLCHEKIFSFEQRIILPLSSPLSEKEVISPEELEGMTEIISGCEEYRSTCSRIYIHGREEPFSLLGKLKNGFMKGSPLLKETLAEFGLCSKKYASADTFEDILVTSPENRNREYCELFAGLLKSAAEKE